MTDQPTMPSEPVRYRVGDRVDGRYELRDVLGSGGMATVFRAHDDVLARDVAVKVFGGAGLANDPAAAARATAEVRILAGLSHPNIVSIFDASGATPGAFDHLVMELVPGRTLRQRLDEGPLTSHDAAVLGAELAAGLDYVHERGIVHRDIKPANVLLATTGKGDRAKLADFGVARLLEASPMTMTGTTVGTANYLSPEQATGAEVGPPSDVYSLGLMLLECLTGTMAYPGTGVGAAAARLHRPPDFPSHTPAGGDARWHGLLVAMTDRDPARRPDAGRVVAALEDIARQPDAATAQTQLFATGRPGDTAVLTPATAAFAASSVPPEDERRRRRGGALWWAAAGGFALILAVVLGVLLTTGGDDATGPAAPSTSAAVATPTSTPPPTTSAVPSSTAASTSRPPSTSASRTTQQKQQPAPAPGQDKKKDKGPGGPGGGPGKNKPGP